MDVAAAVAAPPPSSSAAEECMPARAPGARLSGRVYARALEGGWVVEEELVLMLEVEMVEDLIKMEKMEEEDKVELVEQVDHQEEE